MREDLSRQKKVECIARRILIYCQDMDKDINHEKVILDSVKELNEVLHPEHKIEGVLD